MFPPVPPVLARIADLGFKVFDSGPYDLNLFGIRSPNRTADTFDDQIGCAYRETTGGHWIVEYWQGTTDPGAYWLREPMNVDGTAILVPGQYRSAWQIGLHRGSYEALVQIAPVKVYRDNNRDSILDHVAPEPGLFGINIHASTRREGGTSTAVQKWSAGCQVHATEEGFSRMMSLARAQIAHHPTWPPVFSYTLLDAW